MPERPLAVVPVWRWWAGFAAVVAGAGWLSALAYREGLPGVFEIVPQFDKVVHFTTVGLLVFFLDGALRRRSAFTIGARDVPLSALLVLVPAGIEEYLQRYSIYRTSSIWDFVADLLGVLVFLPLSRRRDRVDEPPKITPQ
jgi:VanZ family protein